MGALGSCLHDWCLGQVLLRVNVKRLQSVVAEAKALLRHGFDRTLPPLPNPPRRYIAPNSDEMAYIANCMVPYHNILFMIGH